MSRFEIHVCRKLHSVYLRGNDGIEKKVPVAHARDQKVVRKAGKNAERRNEQCIIDEAVSSLSRQNIWALKLLTDSAFKALVASTTAEFRLANLLYRLNIFYVSIWVCAWNLEFYRNFHRWIQLFGMARVHFTIAIAKLSLGFLRLDLHGEILGCVQFWANLMPTNAEQKLRFLYSDQR